MSISNPSLSNGLTRAQTGLFVLYLVSLVTSISGMELFSTLLGLCLILRFALDKELRGQLRPPPFAVPILAFVGIVILGILLGPATPAQKWYDFTRMRFFLIYLLLFYQLTLMDRKRMWYRVLIIAAVAVGIYGFFQHFIPMDLIRPAGKKIILYAIPDPPIGPLVLGTFNHHLTFANVFLPLALLFLSVGLSRGSTSWFSVAVGSLLMLLCVWTQSRIGWAAVLVTLVWLSAARGGARVGFSVLLIVILGFLALFVFDSGFKERFSRTFIQRESYYALGPRERQWAIQWDIFKEHPLLGIGYNNNERRAREYMDRRYPDKENNPGGHAHSTWLQILSTTGLLGLLAFASLWGSLFRATWKILTHTSRYETRWWLCFGLFLGFVAFHIQGITQWNFGDAEVLHNQMFLWAVLASLVATSREKTPVATR